MIVFAGVSPNSPLLLPSLNPTRLEDARATLDALADMRDNLYAALPGTIVVLAEQRTMYDNAFGVGVTDPFVASLAEFGDLGYARTYPPNPSLIDALQRAVRQTETPVSLTSDETLSYAAAVPLELLASGFSPRVVPIAPCGLDAKSHFQFGVRLKDVLQSANERIAVLACGNGAHALADTSPVPKHADAKKFDAAIRNFLGEKNASGLLQMSPGLVVNAHEALYRELCMLFGVLDGMDNTPNVRCYEAPFGVGYHVAELMLS